MFKAAVVTVSDRSARNEREDASGPAACEMLAAHGFSVASRHIVPDDEERIRDLLVRLCENGDIALVLTTGGTGFAPRDVTPEATMAVVEKPCPGLPEAMRCLTLQQSQRAMLSRAVAGIRKQTLILNLPGNPRAVRECLACVISELPHGLAVLRDQNP